MAVGNSMVPITNILKANLKGGRTVIPAGATPLPGGGYYTAAGAGGNPILIAPNAGGTMAYSPIPAGNFATDSYYAPFNAGVMNPLAPVTGGASIPAPSYASSTTDALTGLAGAGCSAITNPTYRALCMAGVTLGGTLIGGGTGVLTNASSPTGVVPTNCPTGYVSDGAGGCQLAGMAPYIPGDIGRADYAWQPVFGFYGIGASPATVTRTTRVCPAGFKLGKDGTCYSHISATNRLHNPGRKPMLTGGDLNALARARQLQKAIGKLNTRFGPRKKTSCAPRRKK